MGRPTNFKLGIGLYTGGVYGSRSIAPPPVNVKRRWCRPPCQTILPVGGRVSMYSVYLCCYWYRYRSDIFWEKKTRMKNNIWYGNELSEYDTVQRTALVDGRRYLTVVRRMIAVSIGGIRECMVVTTPASPAWVEYSSQPYTDPYSPFTSNANRLRLCMTYEMSRDFAHPVSFHVMISVAVAPPLFPHADVSETYKRTSRGRSWPYNLTKSAM